MATDSSMFFPNQKALPPTFDYRPKPSAVSGRSYRVSIPMANLSSASAGQTMIFNIPCGRRATFCDPQQSYIRYTVKCAQPNFSTTATATSALIGPSLPTNSVVAVNGNYGSGLFLDHNAYSVFNTSTLYSGSNQIEYINNCNILYNYLLDTNFSYGNAISNTCTYGMYVPLVDPSEIRRGQLLAWGAVGTATATSTATSSIYEQNTFCVPLLSGLLGIGSNGQMVPLHAINDVLRLEILLEQQTQAFCQLGSNNQTPAYSIINAQLELNFVEIGQEGMSLINSMSPASNPTFIVGSSYGHYVNTIKSGTTGIFSCLVPSKLASLQSIHCLPRRSTEINAAGSYSLSSRVNPYKDYAVFKISGVQFPQVPIYLQNASTTSGYGEAAAELSRCFQSLIGTDKATLLNNSNYNVAITANTGTGVYAISTGTESFRNAFAIGLDLALFSSKDTIINGLNCLSESMYFECNISTDPSADITLDFFSVFDNLFIIDTTGYVSSRR